MARESKRKRDEKRFGNPERLADMVLGNSWEPPAWCRSKMEQSRETANAWLQIRDALIQKVATAKLFAIDNVSDYYFEHPKSEWIYKSDFPSIAPPFPSVFVEAGKPPRVVDGSRCQAPAAWVPERYGFLLEAMSFEEVAADAAANNRRHLEFLTQQAMSLLPYIDEDMVREAGRKATQAEAMALLGENEALFVNTMMGIRAVQEDPNWLVESWRALGLNWLVRATLVVASGNGVVCGPLIDWTIPIGPTGSILIDPSPTIFLGGLEPDPNMTREVRDTLSTFLSPALLAVCFMNCKNVTLDTVEPDREINRERRKVGKKPFLRYHTINIEPMKSVLRTEGGVETNGLKKALHICRGHFATYSPEKPLFGHFSGTVWKPAHVRGSAKQGVVVSDYNVKAPAQVAAQ